MAVEGYVKSKKPQDTEAFFWRCLYAKLIYKRLIVQPTLREVFTEMSFPFTNSSMASFMCLRDTALASFGLSSMAPWYTSLPSALTLWVLRYCAGEFADKWKDCKAFRTHRDMLNSADRPDAVIIGTPPAARGVTLTRLAETTMHD